MDLPTFSWDSHASHTINIIYIHYIYIYKTFLHIMCVKCWSTWPSVEIWIHNTTHKNDHRVHELARFLPECRIHGRGCKWWRIADSISSWVASWSCGWHNVKSYITTRHLRTNAKSAWVNDCLCLPNGWSQMCSHNSLIKSDKVDSILCFRTKLSCLFWNTISI